MSYTVEDVSRISGVSLETLRYYDEMGLVSPVQADLNGYPYYEEEHLLRLQQVMLYRELDLPLAEIAALTEHELEASVTLLSHKQRLIEKVIRIQALVDTINYTIEYLKTGHRIEHGRLYHGFDSSKQDPYEEENRELYSQPTEQPDNKTMEKSQKWSKDDYLSTQREADSIYVELCDALEEGKEPGSPAVQRIIRRHYDWVCHFYTPTKEIYSDLGEIYVDHEDFKKLYAGYHPQLAEYLRDGIKIYADEQMK